MFMQGGLPGSSCLGWAAQCLASQQYVQSPPCCSTLSTLAPLGPSIKYVITFFAIFVTTFPHVSTFYTYQTSIFPKFLTPQPPPPAKKYWRTLWMAPLCLGFCCPSLKVVTFAPFYVLKPKFLLSFLLWHLKSSWKQGQAHSVCVQTALALVKTAKRPGEYVCTMYVCTMYVHSQVCKH